MFVPPARSKAAAEEIVGWLKRIAPRRIASVCSGAYLVELRGRTGRFAELIDWMR